ncbi:NAD(+) synthase [Ureaplasma diversum]|uniref:NH(3)-dependent NAD(+) synthetase n=1 Tax=Ureaplasma diversum NCTC 246 TaxID=1188241 RepID=A0A084EY24_9BACT|nr:NAD(+) synthase [Ureaplasma diversum]KEZ22866.1 NH(3)-dependent NAD(+) synthetase [Ureaplasma diversum NCTC 246]
MINNKMFELITYFNQVTEQMLTKLATMNSNKVVIGISGGVDSALVYTYLKSIKQKYNLEIYPYFLPIDNIELDYECVSLLNVDQDIKTIDLKLVYDQYLLALDIKDNNTLAFANLKSRIRSSYLYIIANQINGLVISNLNYDEYILGFFTKFGDSAADFYFLIGLLKTHIYDLAKYYKVPELIIKRAPSPSNTKDEKEFDENQLGFSYDQLDQLLLKINYDQQLLTKIKNKVLVNEHKHFDISQYHLFTNYLKIK